MNKIILFLCFLALTGCGNSPEAEKSYQEFINAKYGDFFCSNIGRRGMLIAENSHGNYQVRWSDDNSVEEIFRAALHKCRADE